MRLHRTHVGALLAVALPGALWLHPLAGLAVAGWLVLTVSLAGWSAGLVGVGLLYPGLWPWLLAGLGAALVGRSVAERRHWIAPASLGDSLRSRLVTWAYLLRGLRWFGQGPGSTRLACESAWLRSGRLAMDGGPARNEWLQLVYETGIMGVVTLALAVALLWPSLALGSPLTAMLGALTVVCMVTSPLRGVTRWLRGGREGPLFGPPLTVSFTVHLDADGQVHVFGGETLRENHALQVEAARALFNAGHGWMAQHGLTLKEVQGG